MASLVLIIPGFVAKTCVLYREYFQGLEERLVTWYGFSLKELLNRNLHGMCDPNPIIFLRISLLNPVTVATEIIMTARLRAILITDIRIIGLESAFYLQ
jgi:hypothetical protein